MDIYIRDLELSKVCASELKGFYVYALWKDDEIIYVGKSINVIPRVSTHLKDKDFDSYSYIELNGKNEMDFIESRLILKLQPKLNKTLPTEGYISLKRIRKLIRGLSEKHKYDRKYYVPNIRKKLYEGGFNTYHFRGNEYIETKDVDEALKVLLDGDENVGQD